MVTCEYNGTSHAHSSLHQSVDIGMNFVNNCNYFVCLFEISDNWIQLVLYSGDVFFGTRQLQLDVVLLSLFHRQQVSHLLVDFSLILHFVVGLTLRLHTGHVIQVWSARSARPTFSRWTTRKFLRSVMPVILILCPTFAGLAQVIDRGLVGRTDGETSLDLMRC